MVTIRRWYIFLICAISLQSLTWAIIALLSNLLTNSIRDSVTATAFQISVVVISLPVFLVHWLWAQNLARKEADEREADLRSLYLYGTLAAFLGPIAANTFDLIATVLSLIFNVQRTNYFNFIQASSTEFITRELVAIAVLALLWIYHQWVTVQDAKSAIEAGNASVRRLYILGFSATGVWLTTLVIINLLRWLMFRFGGNSIIGSFYVVNLVDETARLMVGLPLWLLFWRWAQALFTEVSQEERESALRKFYLYAIVFIATLTAVSNAVIILSNIFRRLLDLPSPGSISEPLSIIIGMVVLWAYHAHILRDDAVLEGEGPRQAEIRRLYLYLIAGIGLAAFLIGLSGDVSIVIRSLGENSVSGTLREQLAWFTAAILVGLPVWIWPWRQAQVGAMALNDSGAGERRSTTRKFYLYFYLFIATISVLSSAVYIAYRLLSLVLGEHSSSNLISDLGQAIAYCLIAVGVWLYHGYALRGDGKANRREQIKRLEALNVAVVDNSEGRFGRAVLEGLRREFPGLTLSPIGLTPIAAQAMGGTRENIPAQLAAAGLIVGPSNITFAGESVSAEVATAVIASTAAKLLTPIWSDGWSWVGVDRWSTKTITQQTVRAVKQIVAGEEVKPVRPLGAGTIIGIIVGVFFLLIFLLILAQYLFYVLN